MINEQNKSVAPIWYCLRELAYRPHITLSPDDIEMLLNAATYIQKLERENTILNLQQRYQQLQEELEVITRRLNEIHNPPPPRLNAYTLPYGSTMKLGNSKWELISMQDEHPDLQIWKEISHSTNTPYRTCDTPSRVFNPSEVQALIDKGFEFTYPETPEDLDLDYKPQHSRAKFPPIME